MHQSLVNRHTVEEIVDEQKRHSIQNMQRIHHSHHKLNLLEEKMKSLLNNRYVIMQQQNQTHHFNSHNSKQLIHNHYNNHNNTNKNSPPNNQNLQLNQVQDQMLLQNNPNSNDHQLQLKNVPSGVSNLTQRNKSQSSLKIFNNKNKVHMKSKGCSYEGINKNQKDTHSRSNNYNYEKNIDNNHASNNLNFNQNKQNINKQQQLPLFQTHPQNHHHQSIPQQVYQISQLQAMMEKSLQIKQKQLQLLSQQIRKLQQTKVQQYRINVDKQIQLQQLKQLNNSIRVNPEYSLQQKGGILNNNIIYENNLAANLHTDYGLILQQLGMEQQQIKKQNQYLLEQLQQLQSQQYNLKLLKKQQSKELKLKQSQYQQLINQYVNPNNKLNYNNKEKHSLNKNNNHRSKQNIYQNNKPLSNTKLKSISKTKHNPTQTQILNKKNSVKQNQLSKSVSIPNIRKNIHYRSKCQQKTNCQTNQILYSMAEELDRLRDIVNTQIVKSISKTSRSVKVLSKQQQNLLLDKNSKHQKNKQNRHVVLSQFR